MPSKFLKHEACPECKSKNNLARYDDGHATCFGCGYQEQPTKDKPEPRMEPLPPPVTPTLDFIETKGLPKRAITEETCTLFGYGLSTHNGRPVQVAPYRNQAGKVVAQHLRGADKRFSWLGDTSGLQLWGQHLWRQNFGKETGLFVTVTEGEIDAMSVSQVQGNKYPGGVTAQRCSVRQEIPGCQRRLAGSVRPHRALL